MLGNTDEHAAGLPGRIVGTGKVLALMRDDMLRAARNRIITIIEQSIACLITDELFYMRQNHLAAYK